MGHLCHISYDQFLQVAKEVDQAGEKVDGGTTLERKQEKRSQSFLWVDGGRKMIIIRYSGTY